MADAALRQLDEKTDWVRCATDPLSRVTEQIRLQSLYCSVLRATPPFAFTVRLEGVHVYLVTRGRLCLRWIQGADAAPIHVEKGDVLIVPHGRAYRIQSSLDVPRSLNIKPMLVQDFSRPRHDEIEWLGMACSFDASQANVLTDVLPHAVRLKRSGLTHWLKQVVELFQAEHRSSALGRGAVLARLGEIVLMQALRIWIGQLPHDAKGWLTGLRDERIALALRAIHNDPGYRWRVDSLADQAGMSRSAFANRFRAIVGVSPMRYVSRWRMHCAIGQLSRGVSSVKSVIDASGYKSAATFRLNFKRQFGSLPGLYCNEAHVGTVQMRSETRSSRRFRARV